MNPSEENGGEQKPDIAQNRALTFTCRRTTAIH